MESRKAITALLEGEVLVVVLVSVVGVCAWFCMVGGLKDGG